MEATRPVFSGAAAYGSSGSKGRAFEANRTMDCGFSRVRQIRVCLQELLVEMSGGSVPRETSSSTRGL
jgi:hypothetical protein